MSGHDREPTLFETFFATESKLTCSCGATCCTQDSDLAKLFIETHKIHQTKEKR